MCTYAANFDFGVLQNAANFDFGVLQNVANFDFGVLQNVAKRLGDVSFGLLPVVRGLVLSFSPGLPDLS
jgi:hypothetical protein